MRYYVFTRTDGQNAHELRGGQSRVRVDGDTRLIETR